MKKLFFLTVFILIAGFSFAQEIQKKILYSGGVYGQTFELIELSDDEGCILCLYMTDNKNTNKNRVTFYDSEVPVVYHIYSPFFTNSSEYSKAIDACKEFLTKSMNYIYLADIKDICDIAPCCELVIYKVFQDDKGEKYIDIEYDCSDLKMFFEIASMYNAKGRAYVMEKYLE